MSLNKKRNFSKKNGVKAQTPLQNRTEKILIKKFNKRIKKKFYETCRSIWMRISQKVQIARLAQLVER